MARVTFFELSVDDPKRAMKFYETVFGWKFQKYGDEDYWLITTGDQKELGINGAIRPREAKTPNLVNTIGVKDIDKAIRDVETNGGKLVIPKTEIPMQGTLAYVLDSEGNMHGIMQPVKM